MLHFQLGVIESKPSTLPLPPKAHRQTSLLCPSPIWRIHWFCFLAPCLVPKRIKKRCPRDKAKDIITTIGQQPGFTIRYSNMEPSTIIRGLSIRWTTPFSTGMLPFTIRATTIPCKKYRDYITIYSKREYALRSPLTTSIMNLPASRPIVNLGQNVKDFFRVPCGIP